MKVCDGYIENGRFYPIGMSLRKLGRQRAILTILNEPPNISSSQTYSRLMEEASQDQAFLARTLECQEDFEVIDSEVSGQW